MSADAPAIDRRRFVDTRCDHCRVPRRRAQTFVLWHAASGRVRQVGSGCLRDFLGDHDVERLCQKAEYALLAREALTAAGEPASSAAPNPGAMSLERLAAHAARVVRASGWISRERAQRLAQIARADAALRSLQATPDVPRDADQALASGALAWARELLGAKPSLSAFEADVVAVVHRGVVVTRRDRGLVCALIAIYRQRRQRSRHLGRVGEWLDAVVLVERHVERPSERHGTVRRHDLVDVEGSRLVWWQTSGAPLQAGRALQMCGRVARHTYFGRIAVTVLVGCRLPDRYPRVEAAPPPV